MPPSDKFKVLFPVRSIDLGFLINFVKLINQNPRMVCYVSPPNVTIVSSKLRRNFKAETELQNHAKNLERSTIK